MTQNFWKYILITFLFSANLKSTEYEITILATNIANFGGIGEWSFSALLESEQESILFDTGFDENTVLHNANLLKKDLWDHLCYLQYEIDIVQYRQFLIKYL